MVFFVGKKKIKTFIDKDDYLKFKVKGNFISITEHGYVCVKNYLGMFDKKMKYSHAYLHRLITKAPKHLQVDHINGNKLDNRKENLRLCTNASNNRNKKALKGKYKGVYWSKSNKCWIAQITKNYKNMYLGSFKTAKEAAVQHNKFARRLHGKYALLNST